MHSPKKRWFWSAVVTAGLIGFFAGSGLTDESAPGEEEMMKMFIELAKPGDAHRAMDPLVGEWDVDSKSWMGGPEPIESKATSTTTWALGGRYVESRYSGTFEMGGATMPFEGHGVLAYDNFKKEYQSTWYDSLSTNIYWSSGSASEDGKTITLTGTWEGPMGKVESKHVYHIESNDTYTLTGYMSTPEGDQKQMELTFRRKVAPKAKDGRCCPAPKAKGPGY